MPIASDFTVDYTNRRVTHSSGTDRYTVNALYSYLMDLFDDAANMDDKVAMYADTPQEYRLINGWFIDDASYDYLYGGSIRTVGWDAATYTDGIYQITMQAGGYTNCVSGDIGKTVTDGTRSGVLLAYNNTTRKWWVRRGTGTAWSGSCTITSGTGAGTITGSVLTGEDVWANFYTIGTLTGRTVYLAQGGVSSGSPTLYPTYTGYTTGSLDQLVKTQVAGTQQDSGYVTAFVRDLQYAFSNFSAQASATGGRNPIALSVFTDANDDGTGGTDYPSISITFGATSQDIGDGDGNQPYGVIVDGGGLTCLRVWRALKYAARRGAASGTFTTEGQFYRYVNAAYTEQQQAPFGLFAGGKVFGAQGVWITNVSDPNNRVLTDNNGVVREPPVSIVVTVTGVVSGDRVLVARSTGSGSVTVNKTQFTLNGSHTSGTGTVVVNETVGNDIPNSGVIRVNDDRYLYSSVDRGTKTFTLSGTLSATYSGGTGAYVPLIDDTASLTSIVSPTMTYDADFNIVYRVRKKGILPFENAGVVGSAGLSVAAIRTTDSIVT